MSKDISESRKHIQSAIDAIQDLNDFGIGIYSGYRTEPQSNQEAINVQNVERLLDSTDRFEKTCEWIRANLAPIKTINRNHSSYGLKHIAEKEIGYITNGVFIAAMHHCGYRVEVIAPNACFNVSSKSVHVAEKRIKGI